MSHAVVKQSDAHEAQMAAQLSQQYQRAVGGLWEVMKFGAMMLKLREHLVLSARGQNSPLRGPGSSESALSTWLTNHCPDVARPTAYRFMALADGLKKELELGAKADLCLLLDRDGDPLTPAQQRTRNEIALFLEGKSQRQLLFRFAVADPKQRGGYHGVPRGKITPEMRVEAERASVRIIIDKIHTDILKDKGFLLCEPELLENLRDTLKDGYDRVAAALKKHG